MWLRFLSTREVHDVDMASAKARAMGDRLVERAVCEFMTYEDEFEDE